METKSTKRELYDADEYSKKMKVMIANLRTKQPGATVGKVGKNEIVTMFKAEIQALVNDGYTVKQVAEVMKSDVFGVLPKTITQILKLKAAKKPSIKKATVKATVDKKAIEPSSTFQVKPDSDNL